RQEVNATVSGDHTIPGEPRYAKGLDLSIKSDSAFPAVSAAAQEGIGSRRRVECERFVRDRTIHQIKGAADFNRSSRGGRTGPAIAFQSQFALPDCSQTGIGIRTDKLKRRSAEFRKRPRPLQYARNRKRVRTTAIENMIACSQREVGTDL